MDYKIQDIIDVDNVHALMESYSEATHIVTAILDLDGKILIATGWRDICTQFHRACPQTAKRCTTSDITLAGRLQRGEGYSVYRCLNGLVDIAVPIVVQGAHIGNLYTGQFLFEAPDREFFRKQAAEYGFDQDAYLDALSRVPIIPESQIQTAINFLLHLTSLLGEMGLRRIKQLETMEALQESESHYRGLVSQMANGFALHEIICDKDGLPVDYLFLEVNSAFEQLTGLKGAEIVGRTVREVLPQTEDFWIRRYGEVALTGRSIRFEDYSEDLGKHYEVLAYRPRNGEFATIFTDVTKRKQTERELEKNREHLELLVEERTAKLARLSTEQQTILDATRTLMWFKDTENRLLSVNRAAAESVGLQAKEIEGKLCSDLFPKEAEHYYHDDLEVIRSGQPKFGIEEPLHTAAGETLWLLTDKIPYRDEAGNIIGLVVFSTDITERRQAEKALEKRSKELRTLVNAMAGRENRMAELKKTITKLRAQIEEAGMTPVADDPLKEKSRQK
jgi:PAS domain S-box-containing protein